MGILRVSISMGITGLGEFKDGVLLIIIMHRVVNAAARKTFPTKFPFLFGSA